MDRRYVWFIALSVLIWSTYLAVRLLGPQPQPAAVADQNAGDGDAGNDQAKGADQGQPGEKPGEDPAAAEAEKPTVEQPAKGAAPVVNTAHKFAVIGSLDAKTPYRMLVVVDSQGAALRRAELISYRDVADTSGYLGHLELTPGKTGGVVVGLVGRGTPAALANAADPTVPAGLLPGDLIRQVENKEVSIDNFDVWLAKNTRPEQEIKLTVERPGIAQPIVFTARLTRRPLELVKPESHTYTLPDGSKKTLGVDPLSLLVTLDSVGPRSVREGASEIKGLPSLLRSNWELDEQGEDFAQFSFTLDETALKAIDQKGRLKIIKRYELAKSDNSLEGYHLTLRVEVHNLGEDKLNVSYRMQGPTGLPLEGWWYSTKLHPIMFHGAGARDVVWSIGGHHRLLGCPMIVSETKESLKTGEKPKLDLLTGDTAIGLDYVGVDTQFFAAAIKPQPVGNEPIKFRRAEALPVQEVTDIPKNRLRTTDVSMLLATDVASVEGGQPLVHEYQVFLGPKDPKVLDKYDLDPLIEFGWPIFRLPAQLLQGVLMALHYVTRNYGIAIILLTVIVRSCMVPVSLRQARSAAMMQQLAPEVQKIKDKHPDDPLKQHAAVQELYKKHKFNPFGGCLLVFIQLPIFIGLYRCLSVDIDLRDASLFPSVDWITWASNLAGPDKLFYWKDWTWDIISDEAGGWFGPYFNVLPLITVALFLVQQKLFTPPATDEQTKLQQQMMTYMTVFMGIMFYKVPAGLCLYFITSSLWGIAERKMLGKPKPPGSPPGDSASVPLSPKKTSPNGSAKTVPAKKSKKS